MKLLAEADQAAAALMVQTSKEESDDWAAQSALLKLRLQAWDVIIYKSDMKRGGQLKPVSDLLPEDKLAGSLTFKSIFAYNTRAWQ